MVALSRLQGDARQAVGAIREISEVITRINDFQATIAGAVEEQTATTNEMARSAADAARGTQEITANISGVATAVEQTSHAAQNTQQASQGLARMAAELGQLVDQFRYDAGPDQVSSVPDGSPPRRNGKNGSPKPGNQIPYRRF